MEVIRHEHPGGDEPTVATDGLGQVFEKLLAIAVVVEDVFPLIAAGSDVMGSVGEVESKRSCHAPRLPRRCCGSTRRRSSWAEPVQNRPQSPRNGNFESESSTPCRVGQPRAITEALTLFATEALTLFAILATAALTLF